MTVDHLRHIDLMLQEPVLHVMQHLTARLGRTQVHHHHHQRSPSVQSSPWALRWLVQHVLLTTSQGVRVFAADAALPRGSRAPVALQIHSAVSVSRRLCSRVADTALERRRPMPLGEQRGSPSLKLSIPVVQFSPPRSHSHEDLAYAACPICRSAHHMCDMYLHLTTAHRELDRNHVQKICDERLQLYLKVIGTPLTKLSAGSAARDQVLDYLPTVVAAGYVCNWCEAKGEVFPTRDLFFKHVIAAHPAVDIDEIEQHIPSLPQVRSTRHASEWSSFLGGVGSSSSSSYASLPLPSGDTRGPSRRIGNIQAVADVFKAPKPTTPRIVAISVPRGLDAVGGATFTDESFPCELCGKCFTTEENLLKHLELSHPLGTLCDTDEKKEAARIAAEVARVQTKEAVSSGSTKINVLCDLCPLSSKVYTLPSALFSHIRFKHSSEDAAFHVNRMIEQQSGKPSYTCPVCHKAFGSMEALNGHVSSKHSSTNDGALGPQTVTMTSRWWCHDCEKGFGSAKGLHSHLQGKHGLPTQSYPCPACKRTFPDVHSLQDHVTLTHKNISVEDIGLVTQVECPQCERLFLSYEELHRHAVRHHKKDPRQPVREFVSSSRRSAAATESEPAPASVVSSPRKAKGVKRVNRASAEKSAVAEADQTDDGI